MIKHAYSENGTLHLRFVGDGRIQDVPSGVCSHRLGIFLTHQTTVIFSIKFHLNQLFSKHPYITMLDFNKHVLLLEALEHVSVATLIPGYFVCLLSVVYLLSCFNSM